MTNVRNGVFIIESNKIEDEEVGDREGVLVKEILDLIGIENKYYYIRTKKEMKKMLSIFRESGFKYLHIACHGNDSCLGLTLGSLTFKELGDYLGEGLEKRRLFLSACMVANKHLKEALTGTGLLSILGCNNEVGFHDAAIFWASFYRLIFKSDEETVKNKVIEDTVEKLSNIFNVPITGFVRKKNKMDYNVLVDIQKEVS